MRWGGSRAKRGENRLKTEENRLKTELGQIPSTAGAAPTSPPLKGGQRCFLMLAVCCEDQGKKKVTFSLCRAPSFSCDQCPRKAPWGIIHFLLGAEVLVLCGE